MVNFELGNEMWKVKWSTWHDHGLKKKSESLTGIKPITSKHQEVALSTELQELMESKVILTDMWQASCMHLGSALFQEDIVSSDKWIKIVNFELRNEIWKVNLSTRHEHGPMSSWIMAATQSNTRSKGSPSPVDRVPAWCSGGRGFDSCHTLGFSLFHAYDMLINSPFRKII